MQDITAKRKMYRHFTIASLMTLILDYDMVGGGIFENRIFILSRFLHVPATAIGSFSYWVFNVPSEQLVSVSKTEMIDSELSPAD